MKWGLKAYSAHWGDCPPDSPERNRTAEQAPGADPVYVAHGDGLAWLRGQREAAMVYLDPPYGHGHFGKVDDEWLATLVSESLRVVGAHGIVYLHVDPPAIYRLAGRLPWDSFRGQVIWKNGWVSGYKSKSTKFWPSNHHVIVGFAGREWRLRPIIVGNGGRNGNGTVCSNIWTDINDPRQMSFAAKTGWPTEKPITLLERLIEGSTDRGDLVLDPCCGSGTTLLAATNLSRISRGNDVDDQAVSIARARISEGAS